MGGFDPIDIVYKGKRLTIDPSNFLLLGARLERHLPYLKFMESALNFQRGNIDDFRGFAIAQAYMILLTAAGFEYDIREVAVAVNNAGEIEEVFESINNFYAQLYPTLSDEEIKKIEQEKEVEEVEGKAGKKKSRKKRKKIKRKKPGRSKMPTNA